MLQLFSNTLLIPFMGFMGFNQSFKTSSFSNFDGPYAFFKNSTGPGVGPNFRLEHAVDGAQSQIPMLKFLTPSAPANPTPGA